MSAEEQAAQVIETDSDDEVEEEWIKQDPRKEYKSEQWYENIHNKRGLYGGKVTRNWGGKEEPYTKRLEYGPGGEELVRIVAGLQKGVRQIHGTQTLEGAKSWIERTGKKNWTALENDITGDEVLILDGRGNVKVVNGYTLETSDYPWRKAYYTQYPDKAQQIEHPYGQFKYDFTRYKQELDDEGNYNYELSMPKGFEDIRRKITTRNQFRQVFFTPTYKHFRVDINALKLDPMSKSQLSSRIFKFVYETLFEKPAILATKPNIKEIDFDTMPLDKYNKLSKTDTVKNHITKIIAEYLKDEAKQIILFVKCAHLIVCALVATCNMEFESSKEVYGIPIADLLNYQKMYDFVNNSKKITDEASTNVMSWQGKLNEKIEKAREDRMTKINANAEIRKAGIENYHALPMYNDEQYYSAKQNIWSGYAVPNYKRVVEQQPEEGQAQERPREGQAQPSPPSPPKDKRTSENSTRKQTTIGNAATQKVADSHGIPTTQSKNRTVLVDKLGAEITTPRSNKSRKMSAHQSANSSPDGHGKN